MTDLQVIAFIGITLFLLIAIIIIIIQNCIITKLEERKIEASDSLIETVMIEMEKALKYHNINKYITYRDIYNDLCPKTQKGDYLYNIKY